MNQPVRAQELRIGNIVQLMNGMQIVVNAHIIKTIDGRSGSNCYGIPLSESILEKCEQLKYKPSCEQWFFEVGPAGYVIEPGIGSGFIMGVNITGGTTYFIWDIKHLHTFQNIMNLLGKEITVKL